MGNAVRIMEVNMVGTVHILDSFINIAEKDTVAVCLASMSGHIAPVEEKIDKLLDNPLDNNFLNNMEKITKDDTLFSYRIAKRGVLRLVEHRVQEWANKGARIVSISPGLVKTPQGKQVLDEEPEVGIYMVDNNPLKRIGEPDEIAGLIEFLCSEKASYITGTDIRIDGGVTPVLQGK
jgi:NAD(P)-dependent dehydrogenase (short-subunit alcohol dehydrogenase family)